MATESTTDSSTPVLPDFVPTVVGDTDFAGTMPAAHDGRNERLIWAPPTAVKLQLIDEMGAVLARNTGGVQDETGYHHRHHHHYHHHPS